MKKIDKLIISAFLGPFLLTFMVVVFILLTQFLLKYLDDFMGKGLGVTVYAELIFYFSLNMVPMALPLAILLSSLMTFGTLGQHHELTAIKSSGVSLIRILVPIFVIVVGLGITGFFFNNHVVPKANLKAFSLLYDIRQKKPALDLKEGIFYQGIPGYSIKITKKEADGKSLKGVMIYDHTSGRGNTEVIVADSGSMYTFHNEQYLSFDLYNGKSYSEKKEDDSKKEQFVVNSFQKSRIIFSLSSFSLNRTPEELFQSNRLMKDIKELNYVMDSLRLEQDKLMGKLPESVQPFYLFHPVTDTLEQKFAEDSLFINLQHANLSLDSMATKVGHNVVLSKAANQARSIRSYTSSQADRIKFLKKEANTYHIEKMHKYTQAVACIIMFLIGAPLGAIIKKGGLGVPVLLSIVFFIFFYVISLIMERYCKEGIVLLPYGMWTANLVYLPLGLFFLKQAKNDSRLFDSDSWVILIGRIKKMFKKNKK
ncbi:LptF/LptG family permease [Cytophagaceae bacterium ABcell3]|nr:LptF/LptG family permease [Cytophagaceae bacterium ABcell3]